MGEPTYLSVKPGAVVAHNGRRFLITHVLDAASVLAKDVETGRHDRLFIEKLAAIEPRRDDAPIAVPDLEQYSEEEWKIAQEHAAVIQPLIADPNRTRAMVEAAAANAGVHPSTVYGWMNAFTKQGHVSALIPAPRGRKKGMTLLDKKTEAIITSAIDVVYLTVQCHSQQDTIEEVNRLCRQLNLKPPHPNSIRNRINALPPATVLRRRGFKDKARYTYEPIRGSFPGADFPLACVQIDHTQANVIVVDDQYRLPMDRPWITLAIDVKTRMVVGVYVSMEKPSEIAVGQCLARAILPKGEYLADLEVPGDWPVWGKMRVVHADNANEFRGAMIRRACDAHTIDLTLRKVKHPHYGGHIERLMGTSSTEINKLPGTTFSSVEQRGEYDSEEKSALTLREFEQQLVDFIVNVYHKRPHGGLDELPPIRAWELGILGNDRTPGTGMPDLPRDPDRVRIDFMPFEERSVQRYGIVLNHIFYYHEVLNPWINATDPEDTKRKRLFTVRYDPRDISRVYFFDPTTRQYYPLPYRDPSHGPISHWEVREAKRLLKAEGRAHVDEAAVFGAIERIRKRSDEAVTKTKAARKKVHRASVAHAVAKNAIAKAAESAKPKLDPLDDLFADDVQPFCETEAL